MLVSYTLKSILKLIKGFHVQEKQERKEYIEGITSMRDETAMHKPDSPDEIDPGLALILLSVI